MLQRLVQAAQNPSGGSLAAHDRYNVVFQYIFPWRFGMRRRAALIPSALLALLLCGSLSACGQKGPLYLPQPDQDSNASVHLSGGVS